MSTPLEMLEAKKEFIELRLKNVKATKKSSFKKAKHPIMPYKAKIARANFADTVEINKSLILANVERIASSKKNKLTKRLIASKIMPEIKVVNERTQLNEEGMTF